MPFQIKDGKLWNAAFTSQVECEKGAPSRAISNFIDSSMKELKRIFREFAKL